MTTKNIDDLSAAGALAGGDKSVVAQGDAVLKRTTLTALRDWIAGTLAAVASSGAKADVGLGNVANTLHNLSASAAPTVNDDSGDGYSVGSLWLWPAAQRMFRASGVSAGAAIWTELGNYMVPKLVAGRYYTARHARTPGAVATTALNTLRLTPVFVSHHATISELFVRLVGSQAGQNFALSIYGSDPATGVPTGTPLGSTASASTATAGNVAVALTSNVALNPGLYYVGLNCDHATPSFIYETQTCQLAHLLGAASLADLVHSTSELFGGFQIAQSYGSPTWPDLTGASLTLSERQILCGYKVASVP
jgi:hypothetical protein